MILKVNTERNLREYIIVETQSVLQVKTECGFWNLPFPIREQEIDWQ